MIPDKPIILKGRDLKKFEEYQKRNPSQENLNYTKKAKEYFNSNPLKKKS
jgi:hypothetical protein